MWLNIIIIKACPNYVGVDYMSLVFQYDLSRAKLLDRLHFFKSILNTSNMSTSA